MRLILKGLLFIILLLSFPIHSFSQVTIGLNEEPMPGAILQLKQTTDLSNGDANATKGLLLPRVILSKKKELYPMFLKDPENPTSEVKQEYIDNKPKIDKEHTGLLVFNIKDNIEEVLCFGVNSWDGEQWKCLRSRTNYVMDCSTVKVVGIYRVNQPLYPDQHYITMNIIADSDAEGAIYHIVTNTVDGIYFEGKGRLIAGSQNIKLEGKGTPTSTAIKNMTIISNSIKSTANCKAEVSVVIPKKRILGIGGNNSNWGWTPTASGSGSYMVTKEATNFGALANSTMLVEELELIHLNLQGATSTDASAQTTIRDYLLGTNPVDICIVAQDVYINSAMASIYAQYLNNKGVLLVFNEGNGGPLDPGLEYPRGSITNLMKAIWGSASSTISDFGYSRRVNYDGDGNSYPGAVYKLENVDDDILNGPFGNAMGKQWGEDASWARAVTNLPVNDIIVYSYAANMMLTDAEQNNTTKAMITGFRHKTKSLVYFGDGGFTSSTISGDLPSGSSRTINPFYWKKEDGKKFIPIAKSGYGNSKPLNSPKTYDVYNSIIYCNIMAWAIRQAELNKNK